MTRVDDYFLSAIQELLGSAGGRVLFKEDRQSGAAPPPGQRLFQWHPGGHVPLCHDLATPSTCKLLFGMPTDRPLRTGWQIAWYFIGMFTVGVAEEFLFRGVIAQTLLEHFGTSRAGIWKACLLSGFFSAGRT